MTRQFDVFANPLRISRTLRPYLLDVQHPRYNNRISRVVAPLVIETAVRREYRLNPVLQIEEKRFVRSPTEIFTITLKHLGEPIMNFYAERDHILASLDLVFTGI
jgi:CcdB protein